MLFASGSWSKNLPREFRKVRVSLSPTCIDFPGSVQSSKRKYGGVNLWTTFISMIAPSSQRLSSGLRATSKSSHAKRSISGFTRSRASAKTFSMTGGIGWRCRNVHSHQRLICWNISRKIMATESSDSYHHAATMKSRARCEGGWARWCDSGQFHLCCQSTRHPSTSRFERI